jgi:hypothetical protein
VNLIAKSVVSGLIGAALSLAAMQPPPAAAPAPAPVKTKRQAAPKEVTPPPTAAEIADAKTKGMVWVNLKSKVYHKSENKFYGATKNGKFMTESDASAAGYKAAQEPMAGKKAKAAAAASAPAKR